MGRINKTTLLHTQAFASQFIPAVIGVLSFMLLVRFTEQAVLGQFLIYMSAVTLFEMVKSGCLQSAIIMRMSGNTTARQLEVTGSAYWLGTWLSAGVSLVLFVLFFSRVFAAQPGIHVFCGWYGALGLVTLPAHIAEATAVSKQDMKFLLWWRVLQSTNSLCVATFAFFVRGSLQQFATVHLLFTAGLTVLVLAGRKTNPLHIKNKVSAEVKELFHLVRYTITAYGATNLLKSADTFLLGSMLGPKAVAAYAVPLKLTELFEIPLRSLTTTAFPQLAAKHNEGDKGGFSQLFTQYFSWSYLLYLPALVLAFFMAPVLVVLLGGSSYAAMASVFQVFVIYGVLLPADRLSGIALFGLQKPKWNTVKILAMAVVNIAGDFLAIRYSGRLEWVAFASVLNAVTGTAFGLWMMQKAGVLSPAKLFSDAYSYSSGLIRKRLKTA